MKKKIIKSCITTLSICAIVFSVTLLYFSVSVGASCTATWQCTNGKFLSCAGSDACASGSSGGGYVKCKDVGENWRVTYCTGSGGSSCGGGICPELPTNP